MEEFEFRQLVERVKLRSPVETIVGERVRELRKRGALFWARCPFHEERTPSFAVDPQRGTWRCYGACAEGGDVISFVERFDGLPFLDALQLLARAAGEEIPDGAFRGRASGKEDRRREKAFEVLRGATTVYRELLAGPGGAPAREYLARRGLTPESAERFQLGWAPEGGHPLLERARAGSLDEEILFHVGLLKRSSDGRPYDFFRGRLIVPIADRLGRVVGFGGRVLASGVDRSGRPVAKYVNTSETALFHKGRLVYGLHLAADAVRKGKHLVLVEGYTDVIAAHQVEIPNVAAVLGTSTTEDHAALVRRSGARRVTLVFDGDDAGRQATRRALAGLLPLDVRLDVIHLEDGEDPCDLLLAPGGATRFGASLDDACEWFAWCLDGLRGLSGPDLARGADELFALLRCVDRPVEQDARLIEMARELKLAPASVRRQFERGRPGGPRRTPDPVRAEPSPPAVGTERAFRLLVGALLVDNSLIPLYGELCERCPEGDLALVFRTVLELYENGDEEAHVDANAVMTHLGDHAARGSVVHLEGLARAAESPMALARDQALWLERTSREEELTRLKRELIEEVEDVERPDLLADLHAKLRRSRVPDASSPRASSPNPGPTVEAGNP